MLFVGLPVAVFVLVLGAVLLYWGEKERELTGEVLTADRVVPGEEDLKPNWYEIRAEQRKRIAEAQTERVLGHPEEARRILDAVLEEDNPPAGATLLLAQIEREEGRTERAGELLDRAITNAPTPELFFARGVLRMEAEDSEGATADMERAMEMNPGRPIYENARLLILLQGGRQEEVVELVASRRNLDLHSLRDTWILADAALQAQRGDWVLAGEYLRQARNLLRPEVFATLLQFPPLREHAGHPAFAPFYEATAHLFSFRPEEAEPTVEP